MIDLIEELNKANKAQVSRDSGVTERHIYFITSRTKQPSISVMKKLCKAMNIDIRDVDLDKI